MSEVRLDQQEQPTVQPAQPMQPVPVPAASAATPDTRLLQRLGGGKAKERAEAESALEQMGPQAVEALLEAVRAESAKFRRQRRLVVWGSFAFLTIVLVLAGSSVLFGSGGKSFSDWVTYFPIFTSFVGAAALSQAYKGAARGLAKFDDPRSVGPFADLLGCDDKDIRLIAETKLTQLLPRLSASDAGLLEPGQRKALYRALAPRKSVDLVLAILGALQQVGDSTALPHVEKLAQPGATAVDARVRQAAQECLPLLQRRAEKERAEQMLLRPALPGDPATTLLRPAEAASETDPGLLLRPTGL